MTQKIEPIKKQGKRKKVVVRREVPIHNGEERETDKRIPVTNGSGVRQNKLTTRWTSFATG